MVLIKKYSRGQHMRTCCRWPIIGWRKKWSCDAGPRTGPGSPMANSETERIHQSCPALDQNSDLYTPLWFSQQMWHVLEGTWARQPSPAKTVPKGTDRQPSQPRRQSLPWWEAGYYVHLSILQGMEECVVCGAEAPGPVQGCGAWEGKRSGGYAAAREWESLASDRSQRWCWGRGWEARCWPSGPVLWAGGKAPQLGHSPLVSWCRGKHWVVLRLSKAGGSSASGWSSVTPGRQWGCWCAGWQHRWGGSPASLDGVG